MATGCDVLRKLWDAALECKVEDPSISGTPGRMANPVQCKNIRDCMTLASLKCWEERTTPMFPPIIVVQDHKNSSANSSNIQATKQQNKGS